MDRKPLSVAILGSRGIPNRYGGFEACAEQLGIRLAEKGHRVTVYSGNDHPVKDEYWQGVRRIMKPNPERMTGTFGQFLYDFHCNLHTRKESFDIILHLGYTSDSVWYWLWPEKGVHIVNMDGQEWKRPKYNRAVRKFLKYAEYLATLRSRWLIADSKEIKRYLEEHYRVPVRYIAYGAEIPGSFSGDVVQSFGLSPHRYDLVIARMEPDNNIEMAIRAKLASRDDQPLVIVGNKNKYRHFLEQKYSNKASVIFMDAVYEAERINSLRHFSRLYIHGHSVGGTNPSLLEAMACGCRIAAHRNPFNLGVLGESAFYYSDEQELSGLMNGFDAGHYAKAVKQNLEKVRKEYNWDAVTDAYENLFFDATRIT